MKKLVNQLLLCAYAADSQRWSRADELPAPAQLRGRATYHHPLPERLSLEVSSGSAGWPRVSEIQGLDWRGV